MLKLLIPILDRHGAAEAARHSAFLFAERCVSMVEVAEVLKVQHENTVAARSRRASPARREDWTPTALQQVCAILDDAGVPYTCRRVAGPPARVIAACVEAGDADIVVVDTNGLGFLRKWRLLARLRQLCTVPVTLLE
ncbi:universal stress protein [Paraburkholderia sp.]|uniref:universal stress protein n=1 Tax=Paraburkholderia sp. TaxID=1926495 RepID=UPI0039E5D398